MGHASSGMLVLGVSLTAVSPCCHLKGEERGQQTGKCTAVFHRGNERTFMFVTLYCFATGIVIFLFVCLK